ncbi:MAG: helix-turn-helix domain-containing protein [Bacteroidota bacterium]
MQATYSFSALDVLLFLGANQGIFLMVALLGTQKGNQKSNKLLAWMVATAVVVLIGRALNYRITANWYFYVASLVDTSIFLFAPLSYFYLKRLLFKSEEERIPFWHFVPSMLHLIYAIVLIFISKDILVRMGESGVFSTLFFCFELLGILSFIGYLLASVKLCNTYEYNYKFELAYEQRIKQFSLALLICWGTFSFCWAIQFTASYFFARSFPYFNYVNLWIVIALAVYTLGYFGLRHPEVFQLPIQKISKQPKARLQLTEIQQLQKRLDFYIKEEKVYLESELSLRALAKKLDTTSNNLSWLLNQVYQKTFYDFINSYRVKAVIDSMQNGQHRQMTLLALALNAGFKSKSTFNKIFKQETGLSPTNYLKVHIGREDRCTRINSQ